MQIAYILETWPSLTETFIAREIEALRRRGFAVEIFALRAGEGARPIEQGAGLAALPVRALSRLSPAIRTRLWKEIGAAWYRGLPQGARSEIEHIHAGFASVTAAIAWGAAEAGGLRWSFSGHARDLFVKGCDLHALTNASAFATACTREGVRALEKAARRGKSGDPAAATPSLLYAPHGLQPKLYPYAPRLPAPGETPRILSVGRLVEKKGFDVLLRALELLRDRGFAASAEIIGEGPLKAELRKRIGAARLEGHVRLRGALPHETVMQEMLAAHCLVFAGREAPDGDRDGLPNVLLEAAAVGLPLVASNAGSASSLVSERTGALFQSGDALALAGEIEGVFTMPGRTRARAAAARERVERDFDIDRNIEVLAASFSGVKGTPGGL